MTRLLDASNIECRWEVTGIDALKLSSAQTLDVLRFLQEALTNVVKHSGATHVTARVCAMENRLDIEVIDNGKGMPSESISSADEEAQQGAGMRSMQARAQRLGGQWRMQSAPGRTFVAIDAVPLDTR